MAMSVGSYLVARQANQIAQEANEIAYRGTLPVISAIRETSYDESTGLYTHEITLTNDGKPLTAFRCLYAYTLLAIEDVDVGVTTRIPLDGYTDEKHYTGNSQGLLLTCLSKNNLPCFKSIAGELEEAAQKDGYGLQTKLAHILLVGYRDYEGKPWRKYLFVGIHGSLEMDESEAKEIMDAADRNRELAESKALDLHISRLSGSQLWDWYKKEILENQ